jgi:hypothetical protein
MGDHEAPSLRGADAFHQKTLQKGAVLGGRDKTTSRSFSKRKPSAKCLRKWQNGSEGNRQRWSPPCKLVGVVDRRLCSHKKGARCRRRRTGGASRHVCGSGGKKEVSEVILKTLFENFPQ